MMFDNSIFASFIPQILMVIGYLSCLLAPGYFKSEHKELPVVQQFEVKQNSIESSIHIFDLSESIQYADLNTDQQTIHYKVVTDVITDHFISSRTCDGIAFKLFSRPPPFIIC